MIASPSRIVTIGLILAAAAMFSVSSALERQDKTTGHVQQPLASSAAWNQAEEGVDPLFGLDLQSISLIVAVVAVSAAVAVALVTIASAWSAAVIALVMLILIGLDFLTVIVDVGRPGGSPGDILAVLVMMLHVVACFTTVYIWSETRRAGPQAVLRR